MNVPTPTGRTRDRDFAPWHLASHVRLVELPAGGHVLVDLRDLSCHELGAAAVVLLTTGALARSGASEEEREFFAHAMARGWISRPGIA